MDQRKIGDFIMLLRRKNKLTQNELASLIFVARETIGKWERGVNIPDAHSLVLLADIFNVSINEIIAGEFINATNKDKIQTLALNVIEENNENKKTKRHLIIISTFIIIILFLFAYFIYNFNSMRVYLVYGENDLYSLSRSLVVLSKQKSYIQIGNIMNKETSSNIVNESAYKISVFYEKNNQEKLIFSSTGGDTLYTNLSDNANLTYRNLLSLIDKMFIIVEKEDSKSRIDLNVRLDYTNNQLFKISLPDEEVSSNESNIEAQNLEDAINTREINDKNIKVIDPVEYETPNEKITLSATCFEEENTCRVSFTMLWIQSPKVKSYDLVGVRLSDTIFLDEHYTILANDYIEPEYTYHSHRGLMAIFDLSKENIQTITAIFNVEYRGSIYASYQHAIKQVDLEKIKEFNFSPVGLGEVFSHNSKRIERAYDDMPGIKLILKE